MSLRGGGTPGDRINANGLTFYSASRGSADTVQTLPREASVPRTISTACSAFPSTKADRFKAHVSESKYIRQLGIPQAKIDKVMNSRSGGGVVSLGGSGQYVVVSDEVDEPVICLDGEF